MRNLLLIFLAVCMVGAVQGASIVYLNESGVTDLSDGAAWYGGVAPGADGIMTSPEFGLTVNKRRRTQ